MTVHSPTALPEIRDELCQWYQDGRADNFFASMVAPQVRQDQNDSYTPKGIGLDALGRTELFYVSPPMADLAIHASSSMPDYVLQREDLPAQDGLLYSPRPLWANEQMQANGVVWTVRTGIERDQSSYGGLLLSWLSDRSPLTESNPEIAPFLRGALPRVFDTQGATFWPFNNDLSKDLALDGETRDDRGNVPQLVLKTVWMLMQQSIAAQETAPLDRATRRRLTRKNIEPAPIRVIMLRRPSGGSEPGDSDREYQHQWIVRGHWRQQWYPQRGVHRPLWIAPHIKGPEGAPLLGGEKVYSWTR